MVKHTPGPLTYGREISQSPVMKRQAASILKNGIVIARVASISDTDDEVLANARLYAAAPDLFGALKAVEWGAEVDAQEGGFVAGCPCCGAEKRKGAHYPECTIIAAIAKAEGR